MHVPLHICFAVCVGLPILFIYSEFLDYICMKMALLSLGCLAQHVAMLQEITENAEHGSGE